MSTNDRVELVYGRCEGWIIVVVYWLTTLRLSHICIRTVQVPQCHVLLDMLDQVVHIVGIGKWRLSKEWIESKLQVILDMCNVILLDVSVSWLSKQHSGVLIRRSPLLRCWHILHQLIDVRHLQLLQEPSQYLVHVELVRMLLSQSQYSLVLSHPLCLREDVGIRYWNHIRVSCKVIALDLQIGNHFRLAHLIEVPTVQSAKNLQYSGL